MIVRIALTFSIYYSIIMLLLRDIRLIKMLQFIVVTGIDTCMLSVTSVKSSMWKIYMISILFGSFGHLGAIQDNSGIHCINRSLDIASMPV